MPPLEASALLLMMRQDSAASPVRTRPAENRAKRRSSISGRPLTPRLASGASYLETKPISCWAGGQRLRRRSQMNLHAAEGVFGWVDALPHLPNVLHDRPVRHEDR